MRAPKSKRRSVTDGMATNFEKLRSGVERGLVVFKRPAADEFPTAHDLYIIAAPGKKGHSNYLYNIRDRLKEAGFQWLADHKVWYRSRFNADAVVPL